MALPRVTKDSDVLMVIFKVRESPHSSSGNQGPGWHYTASKPSQKGCPSLPQSLPSPTTGSLCSFYRTFYISQKPQLSPEALRP